MTSSFETEFVFEPLAQQAPEDDFELALEFEPDLKPPTTSTSTSTNNDKGLNPNTKSCNSTSEESLSKTNLKDKESYEQDFDNGYMSPPEGMDVDEGPSDFEDELRAMQEAEAQKAAADAAAALEKDVGEHKGSKMGPGLRREFESTGVFPVASSSRQSQPVKESLSRVLGSGSAGAVGGSTTTKIATVTGTVHLLDVGQCFLPPLRAETASGDHVTFKRRLKPRAAPVLVDNGKRGGAKDALNLLTTPLHILLAQVEEIRSQRAALQLQHVLNEDNHTGNVRKGRSQMTMWVDKYRPKKFSDLLGEDRVHREVLAWLKEWDRCVHKRIPTGKKRREDGEMFDPLGRPRDKILLLSGPPGYGKTTLAHIVARHAGYRPLEINASDDRSAATVSTRIKNAIDAGSGLGSEGRPTCVIIDEIDGATGSGDQSFVRSLLKLIQDVPARKKTNTPAKLLRRPIICICNDLYAPSLRHLRPFARVIRFKKPQSQFIVKRLREVCDREALAADLRVLTLLVDVTGGDIRSCLNTLQFIKSRSSTVTEDAIKSSSVGMKDTGTTLQTVWNSLLVPMAAKQRRQQIGIDDGRYVDRLAFQIQSCGEYDRIVQGCFEHYTNLKPLDASFTNITRLHDWVAYYDRLSGRVGEHMEFELLNYAPYAVVPWYSHFAAPANATRPAEWPKADYESFQARTANEEIANSLKMTIPPAIRCLFSTTTTLTELIPLLMRIISPPLKPVNANIVKPGERAVLARLVELMIPLGLRFWQEKAEDGQPMMRLEPAIDVFIHYEGKRAADVAASRFAVRQLIAQAMDAELARRRGQAGADSQSGLSTAESLAGMYGVAKTGKDIKIDTTNARAAPVIDFFGRAIVPKALDAVGEIDEGTTTFLDKEIFPPIKKFKVFYKFNEGSSSAVRKNIKMSALM